MANTQSAKEIAAELQAKNLNTIKKEVNLWDLDLSKLPETSEIVAVVPTLILPQVQKETKEEKLAKELERTKLLLIESQENTRLANERVQKLERMVKNSDLIILRGRVPTFTVTADGIKCNFVNYEYKTSSRHLANTIKAMYNGITEIPNELI